MHHRIRIAALAVLVALAATAVATAHTVYPTIGETSLTLSQAASDSFATAGVTVTAPDSFPIADGGEFSFHEIDDPDAGGTLPHSGEIVLTEGSTTIALKTPRVTIAGGRNPAGVLNVGIGDDRFDLATLDLSAYEPSEDSPGFDGARARLTQAAADLLNSAFSTDLFAADFDLGEVATTGVRQPVRFTKAGRTKATLSKGALTLMAENDVLVRATGAARARGRTVTFPITGGRFDVVSFVGRTRHKGGLSFGAYETGRYNLAYEGDRGYVIRSDRQEGLALFTVGLGEKSTFGSKGAITVGKGELFFAIEAARDLAPALGVSPRKLARTRIGTIDVDAPYVDLAR